jgi:hypothetical protein
MARRFDQYYQVKPRDNLGDPEYWNRRFDDIDRRVSSNEDGLDAIGGLTAYVEGLALDRLDLVLAPALDKITLVSQQGFLLAHSTSSITLDTATTQVFAIPDDAERELFAPSPFVTIVRQANTTDYAFAKLVDWNKVSGQLTLQPIQIWGSSGPFDDWVIYVGTAISEAVEAMMLTTEAARDLALQYRDAASASASQTAADRTSVNATRADVYAARDAAQQSALNAQTWDPSYYSTTQQMTAAITTAVNEIVNGAPGALETLAALAEALGGDVNFSTTVTNALANRLRVDIANQGLDDTQKSNARANMSAQEALGFTPVNKAGDTITGGLSVNGELVAAAGYLRFGTPGGPGYIQYSGGATYFLGSAGNIWHSGNITPVIALRCVYVGDWYQPIRTGLAEPFGPNAVATGFGNESGGVQGYISAITTRFRALQYQLSNGGWYSFGAA